MAFQTALIEFLTDVIWRVRHDECSSYTSRAEDRVRGDIWLLASRRLINWSHTETKGMQEMLLTEIWAPDIIWRHLGRIYSSISQQHILTFLFKSDFSVFYHLPCPLPLCVAGILSLEDTLVIILYVSHPPSLSASLFVSFSLPLCPLGSGHQNIFIQWETKQLTLNTLE